MIKSLIFFLNIPKNTILVNFFLANCSFFVSKKANEQFAQKKSNLLIHSFIMWATWANCSWSLICPEWPEQFAHGHSFDMSDLRDLLKVAHLSWVIWANCSQLLIWFEQSEQMSDERRSKFPTMIEGAQTTVGVESLVCCTEKLAFSNQNNFGYRQHRNE